MIFIIPILILSLGVYAGLRNNWVWAERKRFIEWLYTQPDWQEKRKLLENPSYNRMFLEFWKPVTSYYKEYLQDKLKE